MFYTEKQQYWIWLSSVKGIGPSNFFKLLDEYGEPENVWGQLYVARSVLTPAVYKNLEAARDQAWLDDLFDRMEKLPLLADMREPLEFLLTAENDADGRRVKQEVVEDICANVIRALLEQGLTDASSDFLEPHAFAVQERIEDPEIRAMHVMEG